MPTTTDPKLHMAAIAVVLFLIYIVRRSTRVPSPKRMQSRCNKVYMEECRRILACESLEEIVRLQNIPQNFVDQFKGVVPDDFLKSRFEELSYHYQNIYAHYIMRYTGAG